MKSLAATTSQQIKACCAATYGGDWARLLTGDSMHPGGVELTLRMGQALGVGPGSRVLDVASGRGASAVALASRYGCEVIGVDLSASCITAAYHDAARSGLADRLRFQTGDAEALPLDDDQFDAVICECAFCTFPDKPRAAQEIARVLRPGGRLGFSDLVLRGEIPSQLRTLAAWVACIGDARPVSEYIGYFEAAGFRGFAFEVHDEALTKLIEQIRGRLFGAKVLAGAGKVDLAGIDLDQAAVLARAAESAVRSGVLGYILLKAVKPAGRV